MHPIICCIPVAIRIFLFLIGIEILRGVGFIAVLAITLRIVPVVKPGVIVTYGAVVFHVDFRVSELIDNG
jgi:hypothetical protein